MYVCREVGLYFGTHHVTLLNFSLIEHGTQSKLQNFDGRVVFSERP